MQISVSSEDIIEYVQNFNKSSITNLGSILCPYQSLTTEVNESVCPGDRLNVAVDVDASYVA